jgi:hypothetical protein
VRIRNLRIFTLGFIILVLVASYGLALLRTYVFKPAPPSSAMSKVFGSFESIPPVRYGQMRL